MNKPVDTIEFWDKRIEESLTERDLSRSVFLTGDWKPIDKAHLGIIKDHLGVESSVLEAGCGYGRSLDLILPCKKYVGIDQVPKFIEMARDKYGFATDRFATDTIAFYEGVIPDEIKHFDDNCFDWVVCISLMVMIISNLGWGKWDTMQKELLRVSRNGVLCLEYTDPEVYYLVRSN